MATVAEKDAANEALVREAIDAATADSTNAKYKKGWEIWTSFCDEFGFAKLPAQPSELAKCAAAKAKEHNSVHPVKTMCAAVYAMHVKYDYPSPTENERFQRALRGLNKIYYKPPKRATPMEVSDLHKLIDWHLTESNRPTQEKLRSWRTIFRLVLSYRSILRYDDIMRLRRQHITFVDDKHGSYMRIWLPSSKNDQKGEGRAIPVPPYDGEAKYCISQITKRYLAVLNSHPDTPLQQGIVKQPNGGAKLSGKNITRSTADKDRVWAFEVAGMEVPKGITEHSGRRGAATQFMDKGGNKDDLKRLAGWKSDTMAELYSNQATGRALDLAKQLQ